MIDALIVQNYRIQRKTPLELVRQRCQAVPDDEMGLRTEDDAWLSLPISGQMRAAQLIISTQLQQASPKARHRARQICISCSLIR